MERIIEKILSSMWWGKVEGDEMGSCVVLVVTREEATVVINREEATVTVR